MKYLLVVTLILTITSNFAYSEEPAITKDPVLATILSLGLSGLGHMYTEEYAHGALFMIGDLVCLGVITAGTNDNLFLDSRLWDIAEDEYLDPDEDDGLIIIGGLLLLVNRIQSAYLSHKKVEAWNSRLNLRPISNSKQKGLVFSCNF